MHYFNNFIFITELQNELLKTYQRYNVKTSFSPLMQQKDNINVKDVFVPPVIEVLEGDQSVDMDNDRTKKIEKFRTLNESPTRRNDVLGYSKPNHRNIRCNVGSEKYTSCKMINRN
jgi:hypothetical protein